MLFRISFHVVERVHVVDMQEKCYGILDADLALRHGLIKLVFLCKCSPFFCVQVDRFTCNQ